MKLSLEGHPGLLKVKLRSLIEVQRGKRVFVTTPVPGTLARRDCTTEWVGAAGSIPSLAIPWICYLSRMASKLLEPTWNKLSVSLWLGSIQMICWALLLFERPSRCRYLQSPRVLLVLMTAARGFRDMDRRRFLTEELDGSGGRVQLQQAIFTSIIKPSMLRLPVAIAILSLNTIRTYLVHRRNVE